MKVLAVRVVQAYTDENDQVTALFQCEFYDFVGQTENHENIMVNWAWTATLAEKKAILLAAFIAYCNVNQLNAPTSLDDVWIPCLSE